MMTNYSRTKKSYLLVLGFFKGDKYLAHLWFNTENPLLGNISPRDMIRLGRGHKVFRFIEDALAENERD